MKVLRNSKSRPTWQSRYSYSSLCVLSPSPQPSWLGRGGRPFERGNWTDRPRAAAAAARRLEAVSLRPRRGCANKYISRSRIRENYDIDYVPHVLYARNPAHRGALSRGDPEGGAGGGVPGRVVKPLSGGSGPLADRKRCRQQGSPAQTSRRQLRSRARSGPKTVTVERREAPFRLRGTAHASQTWRRAITRATG